MFVPLSVSSVPYLPLYMYLCSINIFANVISDLCLVLYISAFSCLSLHSFIVEFTHNGMEPTVHDYSRPDFMGA